MTPRFVPPLFGWASVFLKRDAASKGHDEARVSLIRYLPLAPRPHGPRLSGCREKGVAKPGYTFLA